MRLNLQCKTMTVDIKMNLDQLAMKYTIVTRSTEVAEAELTADIKAIFDCVPEIKQIMAYGSTPDFNDGDICRHYGGVYIDGWSWNYKDNVPMEGDSYIELIGDELKLRDQVRTNYKPNSDSKFHVGKVFDIVNNMEKTIMQEVHESNYLLLWTRQDDGSITFNKSWLESDY